MYPTGKRKDPEPLQYDWFLNSDKTECEIRKAYEGSEHMSNLREPLGILFERHTSFCGPLWQSIA